MKVDNRFCVYVHTHKITCNKPKVAFSATSR